MRSRPFIPAGEQPRPFSELLGERRGSDPIARALDDVTCIEAEAQACDDPDERKRLQCQAEELRCDIYHAARHQPERT